MVTPGFSERETAPAQAPPSSRYEPVEPTGSLAVAGGSHPPAAEARAAEVVERATVDERRIYALEERLQEVELLLRERNELDLQRELELRAIERDLAVKEGYAQRLELELTVVREAGARHAEELQRTLDLTYNHARNLEAMIANFQSEVAAKDAELAAAAARAAELGALVAEIRSQVSYRVAVGVADRLRRSGPLFSVMRKVVRTTLGS